MDGTTATIRNILTGKMDFGSSSITNGAQVQFVGEAFNDAGGGESSPDRIGALIFSYGTNEKDNQIELRVANHDLSTQSNLKVDGEQAGPCASKYQHTQWQTYQQVVLIKAQWPNANAITSDVTQLA